MLQPVTADLFDQIKTAVLGIAAQDGAAIVSFADSQLERLAKHAILIKGGSCRRVRGHRGRTAFRG